MKVSVAINNYNYGKFIVECIESVLHQTYQNIEIIVVDDGSTDDSLEILASRYKNNPRIQIVSKKNAGQLSAFNEALKHITGEIVFFLDADDLYKKNYIETILKVYKENQDVDFVFCALEQFFTDGKTLIFKRYDKTTNFGFTMLTTFIHREWIGSETSAVSMKTSVLKKILPIPLEQDWITRADDCLVWGSSVVGAKKYYLAEPLVRYRVHANNNYFNKKIVDNYGHLYTRILTEEKLFSYFKTKYYIPSFLTQIKEINTLSANLLLHEYLSKEHKNYKILRKYIKIILKSNLKFKYKYKYIKQLILQKY